MRRLRDAEESRQALRALIARSLKRGHTRVAVQRILMLQRLQGSLPDELAGIVAECLPRLPSRDVRRMRQAAEDWAGMLGLRAW